MRSTLYLRSIKDHRLICQKRSVKTSIWPRNVCVQVIYQGSPKTTDKAGSNLFNTDFSRLKQI